MQAFRLKKGDISFESDKIIISDDAEKQKNFTILKSGLWTFFGIMSVLRYLQTGDLYLLWTGLLIGLGHFLILVFTLLRTVSKEILSTDIKSVKIKKRFGNKFLDIKLKNNRLRRLFLADNSSGLIQYIETNLKT